MKLLSTAALAALIWMDISFQVIAVPDGFEDEEVIQGDGFTIDLVFTSDEKLVTVQKEGIVNIFEDPDGDYSYSKKTVALDISDFVCTETERGLGGVMLHPDFGVSNRYIYLYYTYKKFDSCSREASSSSPVNRLSRFVLHEDLSMSLEDEEVLFDTIPMSETYHNGGKIEFGKDGYIYVTVGDMGDKSQSQNLQNLNGGMIRLTADGGIPDDNPFAQDLNGVRCNIDGKVPSGSGDDAKCRELYAVGLRNPWRFAMNPNTMGNKVHFRINDVGGSDWEEINDGGDDYQSPTDMIGITNYGWPVREGPCRRHKETGCDDYDGYQHPIHYWRHGDDGAAATGCAFVPNGVWPSEYDNGYLYADYTQGTIYLMKDRTFDMEEECLACDPARSNMNVTVFASFPLVVAMSFGPYKEGTFALYYLSTDKGGMLRRAYWADAAVNEPPNAMIETDTSFVDQGGTVAFSAAFSTDPDGHDLTYEWDFDGDGFVDSLRMNDTFAYSNTGIYDAKLTVRDGYLGQSMSSAKIVVGHPPTSGYPSELFQWRSGPDLCPTGYDFCGVLEFCQGHNNPRIYGYRLPCVEEPCECLGISGPLIRLVPGNKYRLTLRNSASDDTNLHTHGLHIVGDGDGDGDDITRVVSGGGYCLDYTWDLSADHPGGTYWYHAHHHGVSEKQVRGGAYGMLIVEDNKNLNPILPAWTANELILQAAVTSNGLVGNGRKDDIISIEASQWYRLRVSLVSVDALPINITFDDQGSCDIHKVATDGIWRSQVPGPKSNVWELTGASRADFAIRCNTSESLVPLYYGDGVASTILVGPEATDPVSMETWSPVRPYSLQDMSNVTVPVENSFTVNLGYDHVNDIAWNADVPIETLAYDQVHEWKMLGTGAHPFHLHLYHVQVVSPGGCGPHEQGEFYDTISAPDDCTVRFITADIGQRCVVHCHILMHEDAGSMAWVNVTGPGMPTNTNQSSEYECAAVLPPTASPTSEFTEQIRAWDREPHPLAQYWAETYPVSRSRPSVMPPPANSSNANGV